MLAAVVAGALLGGLISAPVSAFTLIDSLNDTPREHVTYCVEGTPPGVTIGEARDLLDNAIAHWEVVPGFGTGKAVNPDHDDPCLGTTDVRLRASNISSLARVTAPDNDEIIFDTSAQWWDGIGSRGSDEWCYECILVHEMGHTMGVGHAGGGKWTYDGNFLPSMTQCASQAGAAVLDTLQQDDWGSATYVDRADDGLAAYWNANASFEADFSFWARSSTSAITVGSAYAQTGNRGVRMASSGNWVYMTSVYDPYHPVENPVDNMDQTFAKLTIRTHYRHPSASTTGGVKVQYDTRYLQYDSSITCKSDADADATHSAWSGVTDLKSCGDQGTTWRKCKGSVNIDNSLANTATVFRAYARSTSSGALYIDKTGAWGGTTP